MPSSPRNRPVALLPSSKLLVVGLLASILAALGWQRWLQARTAGDLLEQAIVFEAQLGTRMESFLTLLRGAAGLFAASNRVAKAEFEAYAAPLDLARNYPGMQGVGFSQRIRARDLRRVEEQMRRDGAADFRVWPSHPREEYHAILFLEPRDERNRAAIGYDMFTEETRRAAMERAWTTGRAAMSGTVVLVQEIDANKQPGFLIYFPVYERGVPAVTHDARAEHLLGFVYAPFRVWDFMERKAQPLQQQGIELSVFDDTDPATARRIFGPPIRPANSWTQVRRTRMLPLGDRTWSVVYTIPVSSAVPWWTVLAAGFIGSLGIALILRREEEALARAEVSEAAKREREGELALLVHAMPGLVVFLDQDGTFRVFNERLQEWFGVAPAQLLGRRIQDAAQPENYRAMEPFLRRAMAGEAVYFERWFNPGQTSETRELPARYLGVHLVPHRNAQGAPSGFYAVVSDLTPHKRAEESARFVADCSNLLITAAGEQEMMSGLVRLAVPRVADAAVIFRVEDGGILRVMSLAHQDAEVERKLARFAGFELGNKGESGLAVAARTGKVAVLTRIDPEEVAGRLGRREMIEVLALLHLRTVLHIPVVVRGRVWAVLTLGTADSGRRFSELDLPLAEEISTRVRLAVENALLFAEAQQEILERRRAERTARESEELLQLFVESAGDYAMFLMDPARRVTAWNQGAERILGFSSAEAIGMLGDEIFGAEDRAAGVPELEAQTAVREGAAPDERWHVRKDGTRFWASGHMVALRDEGRVRGFAKIMRDLTGMKQTEEELERRVRQRTLELNEAVQELESFSYSVAHDLRSPLRSIQSFTQFAIDEAGAKLGADERGYLDRVQKAAARLDRLISDLLAYSRVSKTRVELVPVNLCRLVGDICREHDEFRMPKADVRIEGALGTVIGNEAYLTQTVTNLLGNAVKFVPPGRRPEVRVWSERRGGRVRLLIRDNGIGIAPEHQGRIFEIFERLHRHGAYEGTGVGLAIVRRAVQRMNGDVGLESQPGAGTTFWIDLPTPNADARADGASR
jgi:PAS domain S-box-containing protein